MASTTPLQHVRRAAMWVAVARVRARPPHQKDDCGCAAAS